MNAVSPDTMTTIDEIIDNFSLLEEWDDRYRYVIELGRALSPLSDQDRTDANKVQGLCESGLACNHRAPQWRKVDPALTFCSGDSDAHIVRGLDRHPVRDVFRQARSRDSCGRRDCAVRAPRPARAPDAAALRTDFVRWSRRISRGRPRCWPHKRPRLARRRAIRGQPPSRYLPPRAAAGRAPSACARCERAAA